MVIKNKDGSQYKLRHPNPLTKNQEWTNLILHNCDWENMVIVDKKIKPPKTSDFKVKEKIEEVVIKEFTTPEEPKLYEEPKLEKKFTEGIPIVSELPKQVIPESSIKNIVMVHCLPARIEIYKDELYGDEKRTVIYGDKFAFEAVVIDRGDLAIKLWTNLKLAKESIIYPSVYVKGNIKFGDYRWWKIDELEAKSGGHLVRAVASENQPDFSDD